MTSPSKTIACFGETVLRLAVPAGEFPLQSPRLDTYVGGAETNVAVALSTLGHPVRMLGALPDGPIGDAAVSELRRHGVDAAHMLRPAGRMGLYYYLPGGTMRPAEVVYDRADSAFAAAKADDWRWDELLAGVDWLHVSGVTPALGPQSAEATLAAVRAARAAGIRISFDGNWRGRLWSRWNSDPAATLRPIVAEADVLFGNHRDATLLLGREFSGDGPDRRRDAALALLDAFPKLETVASTARHIVEPTKHQIVARIDRRDDHAQTETADITPITDRIGTGDAFAAGVIHGLLTTETLGAAVQRGLALAALKHGLQGDFAPFTRPMVESVSFTAADVAR